MTVVSVSGGPGPLRPIVVPEITGFLIDWPGGEFISGQLQLPLLSKNLPAARALHVGEEVNSIGLYGVSYCVVAGPRGLLFCMGNQLQLWKRYPPLKDF
jgi:hypothetical protein